MDPPPPYTPLHATPLSLDPLPSYSTAWHTAINHSSANDASNSSSVLAEYLRGAEKKSTSTSTSASAVEQGPLFPPLPSTPKHPRSWDFRHKHEPVVQQVVANQARREWKRSETAVKDHAELVKDREMAPAKMQGRNEKEVVVPAEGMEKKEKERGWFGGLWAKEEAEGAREVIDWEKEKQRYKRQQKVDHLKQRWMGKKVDNGNDVEESDNCTIQYQPELETIDHEEHFCIESPYPHVLLRHSDPVFLPPRPTSPFPFGKYEEAVLK